MKLNEIYTSSSSFLRPDDIGTTKPVFTISGVELTEKDFNDGKGMRKQLVLSFAGSDKKLGLNFTNANRIAELVGSDDSDDWVNRSIKLFVENVQVGNEKKAAIRIFPELPPPEVMSAPKPSDNTPAFSGTTVEDESIPF